MGRTRLEELKSELLSLSHSINEAEKHLAELREEYTRVWKEYRILHLNTIGVTKVRPRKKSQTGMIEKLLRALTEVELEELLEILEHDSSAPS